MCSFMFSTNFQTTLLNAIKNDEVFGFIKCDIESPDEMIQKHLKNGFLFPPAISKQAIDDEMLSPFMKNLIKNRKKKSKVYFSTFSLRNYLQMSDKYFIS